VAHRVVSRRCRRLWHTPHMAMHVFLRSRRSKWTVPIVKFRLSISNIRCQCYALAFHYCECTACRWTTQRGGMESGQSIGRALENWTKTELPVHTTPGALLATETQIRPLDLLHTLHKTGHMIGLLHCAIFQHRYSQPLFRVLDLVHARPGAWILSLDVATRFL
jgi:hypothetical protein